jgi:hypothetical protein
MEGKKEGWTNERMKGWMDGWKEGWKDDEEER